jgi:hypothetical protein
MYHSLVKMPWREPSSLIDMPTMEEFLSGRTLVYGKTNPELMDVPFWNYMVRTGQDPWWLREHYGVNTIALPPVWTYDRMGMPAVVLENRLILTIGGEHEDYYDCDFCIYNDVVIRDFTGRVWIYGYPIADFPPTDFHTATYVQDGYGECIYVIGGLRYERDREPWATPVYRLTLSDMAIQRVMCSGDEPGWIFKHQAVLEQSGSQTRGGSRIRVFGGERLTIQRDVVPYEEAHELELASMTWTALKDHTLR